MHASETVSLKQLRHFGFLVGGIFAGVFGLLFPFLKHRPVPPVPLIIGIVLVFFGAAAPALLTPIYRGWVFVGNVLGRINGTILLTLIYFILFVPIALIKRIKGSDPMARKLDSQAKTYRIPCDKNMVTSLEEVF